MVTISCMCQSTGHDPDCWTQNPASTGNIYFKDDGSDFPLWDDGPTTCRCEHTLVTHWFQRLRRETW